MKKGPVSKGNCCPARFIRLALFIIMMIIGIFGLDRLFSSLGRDIIWEYTPLHSALEIIGTVTAIFIALVLLHWREEENNGKFFSLALGFLSMGILDGFHAFFPVGDTFIFLHSIASFSGGLLFSLVWLPRSVFSGLIPSLKRRISWLTASMAIAIGISTLLFPEFWPTMIYQGEFTPAAVWINVLAGLFFLMAGGGFFFDFYYSGQKRARPFIYLIIFFGLVNLFFGHSQIWNGQWWAWHLFRLAGYLIALWIVFRGYLLTISDLKTVLTERDRAEIALKRSESELQIRNHIAHIFLTLPDKDMYAEVLQVILKAMKSEFGIFGYIDDHGDLICPSVTKDIWDQCQIPDKSITFSKETWEGTWGRALKEKRSFVSNKPPFRVPPGHISIRKALSVPLIYSGEVIGLFIVANKPEDYDERDMDLLETIANHTAPILRARLDKEREEKERREAERKIRNLAKFPSENPSPVIRIAKDGTLLYANKASRSLLVHWKTEIGKSVPDTLLSFIKESYEKNQNLKREYSFNDRIFSFVTAPVAEAGYINLYGRDTTERKKAEEATKFAYVELDQIFNTAADAMCIISRGKKILRLNDTFCALFRIDKEKSTGKKCSQVLNHSLCNTLQCPLKRILRVEKHLEFDVDVDIESKNGQKQYFIVTVTPFRNHKGEMIGIVENFKDITQRKRSEQLLKESEEKYSTLVEQARDGVAIIQGEVIQFINKAGTVMTGYTGEELIGISYLKILAAEFRDAAKRRYKSLMAGETISPFFEARLICKDGSIKDVDTTTNLIQYQGKPAIMIITRDVTERKKIEAELEKYRLYLEEQVNERSREIISTNVQLRKQIAEREIAEKALLEERQRLFFLLNGLPGFVYLQAPDYSIRFANRYFQDRFGRPGKRPCYTVLCNSKGPCQGCPAISVHEKRKSREWEWEGPDGRIYEIYDYPFTDIDGSPLALILGIDITERKKMEEELQKTQRLESLGVLAGGIAHDFNNILVSIIGSLSFLKRMTTSEKYSGILAKAEKATYQARDLSRQLLTFSKGGAPMKKTASLSALFKDTISFTLRGSKVKGEFSLPDDLWTVEIDEAQISQVINNLIINADQAMPYGGIIKIEAENVTISSNSGLPLKEGPYVKISIYDQGTGISEDHIRKIFDPYFTTKEGGSGLGLAIAYSIIKKHEGFIGVESRLNIGTTFTIFLPATPDEIFQMEKIEEKDFLPGRGKILFMDDQEGVREIVGDMLIDLGYEVECAREGNEAIELYKKSQDSGQPFDAVMLDLTIPGGMGAERVIRKLLEIDPEVKGIVVSGYYDDPIMSEYKNFGFHGVISKPFDIKELSEILYRVINGKVKDGVRP